MKCNLIKISIGAVYFCINCSSCSKSVAPDQPPAVDSTDTEYIYKPKDPSTAATIGLFLDSWQPKPFTTPENVKSASVFSGKADVTVNVDMNKVLTKVSNYLFGNNSNTWMGQMVDQPKLIQYIKDLSPNIIRAPGGSISDIYFWNQKLGPPADAPDSLLNSDGNQIPGGYWNGKNTQNWTLSIDNYYQMLQQTHSEGIITVNYGYARYGTGAHPVQTAAHLAAEWVRYDNGRTKYWEVGNESNGTWEAGYRIDVSQSQDSQPEIITGELYGRHFKVFVDSMKAAASEIGSTIYIGAQLLGAEPANWQTATDKGWNEGVLTESGSKADFYVVHDYFTPYYTDASADEILESAISVPNKVITYLKNQFSQFGASPKPIALTEWNIFSTGSMQMVSNIAGMHAAIVLGELMKNEFGQASRWDLANGWENGNDHGMFNNGGEPGADKWNPRPVFYYMYYFQKCIGDRLVYSTVEGNASVLCYATSYTAGDAGIVLINNGVAAKNVNVNMENFTAGAFYYWYTLTGGTGQFSRKVFINNNGPNGISGGPLNYATLDAYRHESKDGVLVSIPPYSVVYLQIARN